MANTTNEFTDYLYAKAEDITEPVREKAALCRQDYLAVAAAGAAKNAGRWKSVLGRLPGGTAELIGYPVKTDGKTAALINGFNAHALELDDGQRFAMIHLGASIISAIDAAASENEVTGERRLTGIVMGYEAACRVSIAMQPSHKERGYHAAGTCGTVGAAVGAAFALGMEPAHMRRVLTCAAGSAAGMLEIQEQRSELKPFNVGRAAMDGLTSAYMGFADFAAPDDMLGGERGFFRTFSDAYSMEKLTGAQRYFEIERIYTKPYASCRHSHSAVEAALRLRMRLAPETIDHVLVETYRLGVKGHDHRTVQGVASAKLSTPYAVAAALLYGRADLSVFEPLDEKTVALAAAVHVAENPKLSEASAEKRAAVVTVFLKDGSRMSERVDYAKGEPENPMSRSELDEKCRALAEYAERLRRENDEQHG